MHAMVEPGGPFYGRMGVIWYHATAPTACARTEAVLVGGPAPGAPRPVGGGAWPQANGRPIAPDRYVTRMRHGCTVVWLIIDIR
jgi:hypothetical protein